MQLHAALKAAGRSPALEPAECIARVGAGTDTATRPQPSTQAMVCHTGLGPQASRQGPRQVLLFCCSHVRALPWTAVVAVAERDIYDEEAAYTAAKETTYNEAKESYGSYDDGTNTHTRTATPNPNPNPQPQA